MLDMGFVKDVKKIVAMVKRERQTMFFSATMPQAIVKLSDEMLHNPVRVKVTPEEETIDKIKQACYFVGKKKKIDLLVDLLKRDTLKSVLVFSRTKHGANSIVNQLDAIGIHASAIHGNKSQGARQKALKQFKTKQVRVLIATDIAARGIDVDELSHVINYDLPDVPETYIHRIGRTGRAGHNGVAISFCSHDQIDLLTDIQKHIKMSIPKLNDSVYSIEESEVSNLKEVRRANNKKKPVSKNNRNTNYSRKRTKKNKVEPKGFSKYDSKNQSRRKKK
jgi:ATP-dependent RNA helicase RhlE